MDKVIVFDSWTGGAVNIERLVPAFRKRGLHLFLIHIGSWGHDQDRATEEYIGTLLARDILYYKGLSFKEILEQEKPKAVLFLSTQAFAHQAFNRYCQQLDIPTIHLFHGLVSVQPTNLKRINKISVHRHTKIVQSRFVKNIFRLCPVYAKALWHTGAGLSDWFWFVSDVWYKIFGLYSDVAAPDTSTTACCVYTSADISHATHRYRLPVENIFVVGNPDLVKFGLSENKIGGALACKYNEVKNNIIYIETAMLQAGAVFKDEVDFGKHLLRTKETLANHGLRLLVKLHPASVRANLSQRLSQLDIEVCENEEFVELLNTVTAVIVESSSLGLLPALYGLPLLLARYGKLSSQKYGTVLLGYPRARELDSLDNFTTLLGDITKQDSVSETRTWIEENTGPLPAEKMPDRTAIVCQRLIRKKEKIESCSVVKV